MASFHVGLQRTAERIDLSEKIMETALLEDRGIVSKAQREATRERREEVAYQRQTYNQTVNHIYGHIGAELRETVAGILLHEYPRKFKMFMMQQ